MDYSGRSSFQDITILSIVSIYLIVAFINPFNYSIITLYMILKYVIATPIFLFWIYDVIRKRKMKYNNHSSFRKYLNIIVFGIKSITVIAVLIDFFYEVISRFLWALPFWSGDFDSIGEFQLLKESLAIIGSCTIGIILYWLGLKRIKGD